MVRSKGGWRGAREDGEEQGRVAHLDEAEVFDRPSLVLPRERPERGDARARAREVLGLRGAAPLEAVVELLALVEEPPEGEDLGDAHHRRLRAGLPRPAELGHAVVPVCIRAVRMPCT